jgi:hypothetical protein
MTIHIGLYKVIEHLLVYSYCVKEGLDLHNDDKQSLPSAYKFDK